MFTYNPGQNNKFSERVRCKSSHSTQILTFVHKYNKRKYNWPSMHIVILYSSVSPIWQVTQGMVSSGFKDQRDVLYHHLKLLELTWAIGSHPSGKRRNVKLYTYSSLSDFHTDFVPPNILDPVSFRWVFK